MMAGSLLQIAIKNHVKSKIQVKVSLTTGALGCLLLGPALFLPDKLELLIFGLFMVGSSLIL